MEERPNSLFFAKFAQNPIICRNGQKLAKKSLFSQCERMRIRTKSGEKLQFFAMRIDAKTNEKWLKKVLYSQCERMRKRTENG